MKHHRKIPLDHYEKSKKNTPKYPRANPQVMGDTHHHWVRRYEVMGEWLGMISGVPLSI